MQTGKTGSKGFWNSRGLTLVEIISVLVIISIITAVVVARSSNNQREVTGAAFTQQFLGHIRYAQAQAMNTNTVWGVEMATVKYRVFFWEGGTKHYVSMNAQDQDADFWIRVPNSININPQKSISFDDLGRAYDNDSATVPLPASRWSLYFNVSYSPFLQEYFILPKTGFIQKR